jgi:hypothetical protein
MTAATTAKQDCDCRARVEQQPGAEFLGCTHKTISRAEYLDWLGAMVGPFKVVPECAKARPELVA